MNNENRTREELIKEIVKLRHIIAEVEGREAKSQIREGRVRQINFIKEALLRSGTLQEKLKRVTDGLVAVFDADFARIWITKPGDRCGSGCVHAKVTEGPHVCRYRDRCLHLMASSGRYTHIDGEVHGRVPFGCYKIGRVAAGLEPKFLTNDVGHDSRIHDQEWAKTLGLVSFAGTRLMSEEGTPIGVLALFSKHELYQDDAVMLEDLANTASQVIQTSTVEEALRQSEEMLSLALDGANLGIWEWNLTTGKAIWSERIYRMLGYTPNEFEPNLKNWKKLVHPEDWPRVSETLNLHLEGKLPKLEVVYRAPNKSGGWQWLQAQGTVTEFDADRKPIRITGVVADVTERKMAEEDLRASEAYLRAILNNAPFLMWLKDREGRFLAVNDVFAKSCGQQFPEAVIGKTDLDVWPVDLAEGYRADDREVMKQKLQKHVEEPVFDQGDTKWFETFKTPILDQEGNVMGTTGFARDITERKQAEEALSKQAEFMTHLMESIPLPVFFKDVNHVYVGCNNAFAQFVGLPTERILGKPVFDVVSQETAEIFREHDETLFRKPGTQVYSTSVKRFDGSTREVIFHKATYGDPDVPVSGIIGVILDITDRKILEQQLLQAQKMEAVGTLAGGIAHDFNNLLQAILGYTEILLMKKEPGDPDLKKLEVIQHAARDGADLVSRILAFSKKSESKVRPIDLNQELGRIEKLLRRTLPQMIRIDLVLSDELKIIDADPAQIEQVLINLGVNAQHAMPDGGQLLIETCNVSISDEYLRTHLGARPGKYVLLTVSDTGLGMAPEVLERIFEPFFTTKTNAEGTGLGLSMVHGIVSQHGGYIRCYSEPGLGTSFKIYFPVSETERLSDVALTRAMPAFGTETILLVDDDVRIRDVAQEMIRMGGYKVIEASSGEEALEIYAGHKSEISLVILDLIMPGMGGKRCLEELLRIDPDSRVLFASGYSSNGLTADQTGIGARGFVRKPYDAKDILTAIRKVLDRGHL